MATDEESGADRKDPREHWRTLKWFAGLMWRAAPFALSIVAGATLVQALVPAVRLLLIERLVDSVHAIYGQGEEGFRSALAWLVALVGLSMGQAGLGAIRAHAQAVVRERTGWRLEEMVIDRARRAALSQFERVEFFDRLQRAQWAAIWRSFSIFGTALGAVEMSITLLSFIALLAGAHVAIPVVLIAGSAPILIANMRRGREMYELYREQTAAQRRADYMVQLVTDREAAKEVRLYGLGDHLVSTWGEVAEELRRQRFRLTLKQQKIMGAARGGAILSILAALVLLLWQATSGAITLGAFLALGDATGRFQEQLGRMLQNISQVFEQMLYLFDMRDFIEAPVEDGQGLVQVPAQPLAITCENVTFAYPGGEPVLRDISFELAPGEKLALVGENGAGKTTLIKLLMGLYHATDGRILVNGVDVRDLDPQSLRQRCAAVFQDFLQYQLSAGTNIGYGRVEELGDRPRIEAAAAAGGAADVIGALPEQYETTLGRYFSGGQDLSRGQWQKMALARAYFRRAQLLVFDEPTAALDPRAELEVFEQFRDLAEGRAAVFVSHRMASARVADRILVLGGGRLLEDGAHEQLMSSGGEYARMFALQARWYRDDAPQWEADE